MQTNNTQSLELVHCDLSDSRHVVLTRLPSEINGLSAEGLLCLSLPVRAKLPFFGITGKITGTNQLLKIHGREILVKGGRGDELF